LNIQSKKNCVEKAVVPDNYSTIQEAVNAVCDNGEVIVKQGTYNEFVLIYTPGMKIMAVGNVYVNGGFGIGADDVSIQNFIIDATFREEIGIPIGVGASSEQFRIEVKQNTIVGINHIGIYFPYCKDIKIDKNHISGNMDYGILLDGYQAAGYPGIPTEDIMHGNTITGNTIEGMHSGFGYGAGYGIWLRNKFVNNVVKGNTVSDCNGGIVMEGESSTDNLIANNIISHIYPNAGIELMTDCDHNIIQENRISNSNRGIYIWNNRPPTHPLSTATGSWSCDYNILKQNTITNCTQIGLAIAYGGTNNTVGSGNVINNNVYGIALLEANFTSIFNNTVLDNTTCDIINLSAVNNYNTLKNNKANCIQGF